MSNIKSYVWKDKRLTKDKLEKLVETRLIDMTDELLQMCYTHCKEMLYNTSNKSIGRMILINLISNQLDYCGAELALRWFKSLTDKDGNLLYSEENLIAELRSWLRTDPNGKEVTRHELKDFIQVPPELRHVSIEDLQSACRDALGVFDHSKITYSFIFKLGIYLTGNEIREIDNDLKEAGLNPDKYTLQEKIEKHVKFPLGLTHDESLKINPKGLNHAEFMDMINIKRNKGFRSCRYSELSTSQLKTLRNKVLYALEDRTNKQVKQWQTLMGQIEEVAEYKQIILD